MRQVRNIGWASSQQKQFFECGPDPFLAIGGFNAAKTWGGILKLLYLLDLFPNSRAAVIRSNARHMRKTTMETFYALCPPSAYDRGRRADQEGICQLNNQSLVYFIHLDKPDSLDVLAGLELNFGFVDQAEQITEKAWDTLDARLGRWAQAGIPESVLAQYPNGDYPWINDAGLMTPPPFLFATANPPETEDHFLFVRFAEESSERARWRDEGYQMVRMPSTSNKYASKANIGKMLSKDPQFVKRFVEGAWCSPEGAIFDISPLSMLEPDPELLDRIVQTMHLHRSMDHGDSNPTCVLWEATDHDGNTFVYREHYEANWLVSAHRRQIHSLSMLDIPVHSPYTVYKYKSEVADPSIFGISRGRSTSSGPMWSIADEWKDIRMMPKETAIYWSPAPIPKSNTLPYELVTRSRVKEYLYVDPTHRHPITGQLGAPRVYFIMKTNTYPHGCDHVVREIRGQRRVKIGEREGRAIYGEDRDETVVDHGYDTFKYHAISRPSPTRLIETRDPNVIDIRELMDSTARNMRLRARTGSY